MGWYHLLSITKERRLIKREEARMVPVACPFDATILLMEPAELGGKLRCRFCGFAWDGTNNPLVDNYPEDEPMRSETGPGAGWT